MGRIRVLSDGVIDRIAAGEVVERPASVVKELVENSLDAGARSIEVRLRNGGKASIEIRDDGCGMERDDALLAVERHATSKLANEGDLERIASLGFRGEALSSMASVSRFRLTTAAREGEGIRVEVAGGRVESVTEVGHPRGTTVRVDRLFYNVPARRKFLRADATELTHAVRWTTRHALAHADRRFQLRHGERQLLDCAPGADLGERIAQIHGREFADKLLPFAWEAEGLAVRGLAGRPVDALPRRDGQYLFVNGRAVQDRVLSHAVAQAYGNTMAPGRHPALFLFVEIAPRAVDVNVHPQKTEVRFREGSRVHETVRAALLEALSQAGAVPSLSELRPPAGAHLGAVKEAALHYQEVHERLGEAGGKGPAPAPAEAGDPGRPAPALLAGGARGGRGEAEALAQFRDSYIVAQEGEELVLVDQHAAQERVLFERFLAEAEANRVEVQQLMFPLTLELAPPEMVLVEREREEFHRLGFRLEPFGERTVRLDGVPAVAGEAEAAGLFRELLGVSAGARAAVAEIETLRCRLVTTAACRASIKVNHRLTVPAMQALIDDLYATANPTTCPHGRPILFRLSLAEIERAFRRR